MKKRIVSVFLLCAILISCFCGCSSNDMSNPEEILDTIDKAVSEATSAEAEIMIDSQALDPIVFQNKEAYLSTDNVPVMFNQELGGDEVFGTSPDSDKQLPENEIRYAQHKATGSVNAAVSSSADIPTTGYTEFVVYEENRSLVGYTGAENEALVIPATFHDEKADIYYKVVGIGIGAFTDCTGLISVDIPEGVTFIGPGAFRGCSNLSGALVIPDSVTSIDQTAFYQCTSLESVQIPDSVTSMGEFVFCDCANLQSATIGDGLTLIPSATFSGCTGLENVSIGNQVATIGGIAFANCTSLTSVVIPDSVTCIEASAFSNCNKLAKVVMSRNVRSIGERAFYNTALTTIGGTGSRCSLELPSTLTCIENDVFYGCDNLTKVTLPKSVVSIGSFAFYKCSSLSRITIPDYVTSIGVSAFSHCSSLTKVDLPYSLEEIAAYTFSECSNLKSVSIPVRVKNIDDTAFAFQAYSNLTDVYYAGTEAQWNAITFGGDNNRVLYATIHFGR